MLFSLEKLPQQAQKNKQEFETQAAGAETIRKQLDPLLLLPKARVDITFIEAELGNLHGYFEKIAAAAAGGDSKAATKINEEYSIHSFDSLDAAANDLVEIEKTLMTESSEQGALAASQAHWLAYSLLLAALAIAPVVLLLVTRTTHQLRGLASQLADGAKHRDGGLLHERHALQPGFRDLPPRPGE
jgi:hypothetical protein